MICSNRTIFLGLLLLGLPLLTACESLGYYSQAVRGQLFLLSNQRPLDELIESDKTDDALRQRLLLVQEIRQFAEQKMQLPVDDSYSEFVQLPHRFVVWNVFAAPELSLEPLRWCYPVVGCVSYRGYFAERDAVEKARQLQAAGNDVYVGGVEAYSTIGWFDDPVLSSFINRNDLKLAELLFHELAHRQLYAKGQTDFNESFATAVALQGLQDWLASTDTVASNDRHSEIFATHLEGQRRHRALMDLLMAARKKFVALYDSDISDAQKRAGKQRLFTQLQQDYAQFKREWQGYAGFDRYMNEQMNNAKLSSVASYNRWVPAFRQLWLDYKGDWKAFYQASEALAELEKDQRQAALLDLEARFLSRSVDDML